MQQRLKSVAVASYILPSMPPISINPSAPVQVEKARTRLLSGSVHQPSGIHNPTYGSTGLPVITSAITIHGNGSTIPRVPTAPKFRILAAGGGGYLKLQSTTISGGVESRYGGDGIYVGTNEATGAKLTLVSTREIGITSVGIKISGFWCEPGRGKLRRSRQSRVLYLCGDPE